MARRYQRGVGTEVAMVSPSEAAARIVPSGTVRMDGFEQLLTSAGLDNLGELPPLDSSLTPQQAAKLLAALMQKPLTLANFPPRVGANHLLREVLESGEMSREELLRRVERFNRVAVLRPDGYLAWVVTGRTQQRVGPVEWLDGAFRAHGFELGRFYASQGGVFRLADVRMRQSGEVLAEVYDDADYLSRAMDGAEEAFLALALSMGKSLTYPLDSIAALRHLPTGIAALITSSPEYLERFKYMTHGEQVKELSRLTTTLITAWGTAAGTSRTLAATLGSAEMTVPVLSLTAEGTLVMGHTMVSTETAATVIGTGAGSVYVLSSAQGPRRPSAAQRARVFEKSKDAEGDPRCEYCNKEITKEPGRSDSFEADHKQPYSRGGPTTDENLAPSCRTCNRGKGAQTPEEFLGQ